MLDVFSALDKMGHQRGPIPGEGRNGRDPWAGLVEETTAVWATWIVDAARRAGCPLPVTLDAHGTTLRMTSVDLTYGRRWYFLCPHCGRRVEAVYFVGRDMGCRRCLRLGYRSQKSRPASVYRVLDWVFARDRWRSGRYGFDADKIGIVGEAVRSRLEAKVDALFAGLKVMTTEMTREGEGYGKEKTD